MWAGVPAARMCMLRVCVWGSCGGRVRPREARVGAVCPYGTWARCAELSRLPSPPSAGKQSAVGYSSRLTRVTVSLSWSCSRVLTSVFSLLCSDFSFSRDPCTTPTGRHGAIVYSTE